MPEKASNSLNCLKNSKLHVLILYNRAFSHNYHALLAGRAHGEISTQAVFLFVYCPVYSLYRFVKEPLAESCFRHTILHPLSKVQKHLCHFSLSYKIGHVNFELFVCFVCFVVRNNLHIPCQAGIPRGVVMNHHHRADLPRNHAIYKGTGRLDVCIWPTEILHYPFYLDTCTRGCHNHWHKGGNHWINSPQKAKLHGYLVKKVEDEACHYPHGEPWAH